LWLGRKLELPHCLRSPSSENLDSCKLCREQSCSSKVVNVSCLYHRTREGKPDSMGAQLRAAESKPLKLSRLLIVFVSGLSADLSSPVQRLSPQRPRRSHSRWISGEGPQQCLADFRFIQKCSFFEGTFSSSAGRRAMVPLTSSSCVIGPREVMARPG